MKQGWEIKQLGEVCEIYQPTTIAKKLMIPDGDYPVFGANGIIGKYDKYNHEESELLITCRGATCGSVNISLPKSWINGNAMVVRPLIDDLQKDYLEYLFRGGIDVTKVITGSAQPQITRQSLSPIEIPIPPLDEQKRIVSKLDKCFEAIDKARTNVEKNLQNAKDLFDNLLYEIFRQKGHDWKEKKWGDICDFIRGPFGGSLKKSMFKDSGYVVYEQKHAIHNHFNQLRYFIDEEKFNEMKRFEVKKGDLIMSCSGVTLGRVAIIPENIPKGIINQALLKLTPTKDILAEFIKYWIQSKIFQDIIFNYSGGAAIPNVPSVKILKDITFYLPKIAIQKKVISKIKLLKSQTQSLESSYQQELDALDELKKTILQKAFNGEL
jgi:type I restriction enzyme, S subunit